MKKITLLVLSFLTSFLAFGQDLVVTGIFDGSLSGGTPKTIEVYVINDVADLSVYGIGSANNGGGTDGVELQFTGAATAGDYIYVASDQPQFNAFFGFDPTFVNSAANNNGDDAVELFNNVVDDGMGNLTGDVIDTFGDINTDGNGEPWEYLDGWAYRIDGSGPEGATFTVTNWTYSGINANDDDTTQAGATNPWPIGTYSDMASTEPALNISSPSTNQVFDPGTTSVDIVFATQNFDLTGGNVVEYIVNGGTPATTTTSPITVTTMDGESYSVTLELKDAMGSIDPQVIETATFSVGAVTSVATIAELRAGTIGDNYILTGEAVLTFQQSFRNQKFIEDATAGILIDDSPGTITTAYAVGDGITGIAGTLGQFNGMTQFVPSQDPGAATSTGNAVVAQTVSITDLNANPNDYESEFVKIEMATIDNTVSTTWDNGEEYPISNADGSYVFRTTFFDVDYIGQTVPSEANISGIINERNNGDYFITARDAADIESTATCALLLGTIETTCDSETAGQDGTTTTIAYTGGGTENYMLNLVGGGTIAGDDPSTVAAGTIILENVSEGTTVTLEITSVSCDLSQDLTTPACEAPLEAATIADLRAGTMGEVYTLTGEAVLTFQQDFRNQKFIEDATAGILIDDSPGTIVTTYNVGDGITGIRGTLGEFNGMMQFSPVQDAAPATSTGNAIDAQVVTSTDLAANPNDYESEYVQLVQVTIDNSIIPNWETGEVYELTTQDGAYNFRTSFFDADYIGQAVPTGEQNVSGIITERNNGDYFITARDASDIEEYLSVGENNLLELSIFPNPATDAIAITTAFNAEKAVTIFDVTGKKVIQVTTDNTVNVQELSAGLYIIQVQQNNITATSKLIIK